jgi:hypothetical protein
MAKKKQTESLNEVFSLNEEIKNTPDLKLIQDRPSTPVRIVERATHEKPQIHASPLSMLGDKFEIWKDGKKIFDTNSSRILPTFSGSNIIINGAKFSTIGLNYIVK